ncbi:MAG: peptide-modifying radical SAM enzyme CbpB [Candidatus Omnitrophica bacterium]|nr:peptide-modifying radical SAM enzyme CbpB [Candidatus Omnitrophota bacterium]
MRLEEFSVDNRKGLIINPDNLFWAIFSKGKGGGAPEKRLLSFYKDIKVGLDKEMRDFRFSAGLTAVYIDPTDRCNANCPYCYVPPKIRKNGRSMTKKELILVLERTADYFKGRKKKAVIVFHASEPLLVKDIVFEGIERFSGRFKFGIQTNATLMEDTDVEFLKRHRVGVGISLDSSSLSVNNRLRRGWNSDGNFRKAVSAVEMFDGYEGLNVITTITKFNVTGLPRMVEFLHSKKVPCALLNPVRLTREASRALRPDETLMARYFIRAVDKAVELSKDSARQIIIGNFANTILAIIAPAARRLMCDISPCGGGRCFLTVTASGEMIPCGEFIGLKGFSGGNIFSAAASIEGALQSRPFKKIRARVVEKIDECRICIFRNICGAPCPAELHSLGGMRKPSVFCEFYKEVITHAFKLISKGQERYCLRREAMDNLEYAYRF